MSPAIVDRVLNVEWVVMRWSWIAALVLVATVIAQRVVLGHTTHSLMPCLLWLIGWNALLIIGYGIALPFILAAEDDEVSS